MTGDVQQGVRGVAKGWDGDVCTAGPRRRYRLFGRTYAGRNGVGRAGRRPANGGSGGDRISGAAAGRGDSLREDETI